MIRISRIRRHQPQQHYDRYLLHLVVAFYFCTVTLLVTTMMTTCHAFNFFKKQQHRNHQSASYLSRRTASNNAQRFNLHEPLSGTILFVSLSSDSDSSKATITPEATSSKSSQRELPPDTIGINNNNLFCVNGVTSKSGPLNEGILNILHNHDSKDYANFTLQDTNELITMGSVWAKMETLTSDEILSQYDGNVNDATNMDARYLYADLPRGWGSGTDSEYIDEMNQQYKKNDASDSSDEDDLDAYINAMSEQRYRRILTPSSINAGIDLRIYPYPRRFPSCYEISNENLLYEDTTFIVIDKPPMLPTQPDASNYIECCPSCVDIQLGPFIDIQGNTVQRPLLCHRIDTCVGGIVVLSKDTNGQRTFHQYQRERQLRKMYYAVTTKPVPIGQHIHWMWAQQAMRRRSNSGGGGGTKGGPPCQLVRHTPPDSRRIARTYWNRCVLEVVNCTPIQIDPMKLTPELQQDDVQFYQSTIRLVTGRKHQVRAQLASLGCPIIYDTLYGPIAGYTLDPIDDEVYETNFDVQIQKCHVPNRPIGLQAAGILFGGIKVRANTPWWG